MNMYVQKTDLRTAIAKRLQSDMQLRPTVETAREKYATLDKEYGEARLALFTKLAANPTTVSRVTADHYDNRLHITVNVPRTEQDRLDVQKAAVDEAKNELWVLQEQTRRRQYVATTKLELEAWLVRLDNDVKTETVNIKREFAQELRLI
jgi:hypothetical protein